MINFSDHTKLYSDLQLQSIVCKKGGIVGGGWVHPELPCTWQLPWLAVEKPWSALAWPFLNTSHASTVCCSYFLYNLDIDAYRVLQNLCSILPTQAHSYYITIASVGANFDFHIKKQYALFILASVAKILENHVQQLA